jgi:hypothetical protein
VDRDAIVWSVDTSNFYALVKIQGSNTTIKAHYPRNWQVNPTWLKEGNSVRIRHRSGVQGYVEIIGHGRAIPSPVEGDTFPTPTTPTDAIESGMEVLEYGGGGMNVYVNDGQYSIDGTSYIYTTLGAGYIVMDDPAPMVMGSNTLMGYYESVSPVVIDPAPASGRGRYDALVIGTDGVVDVVKGSDVSLNTEPTRPTIPTDHVLIGYLFIYGGMTSIPQNWIGVLWTAPYANTVQTAATGNLSKTAEGSFEFAWDAGDDTPEGDISFTIKDQYGNTRTISKTATMTIVAGTGSVATSYGGTYGSSAAKTIGSSTSFWYRRNQIATPETHPVIQLEFADFPSLTYVFVITNLDVSGDPV